MSFPLFPRSQKMSSEFESAKVRMLWSVNKLSSFSDQTSPVFKLQGCEYKVVVRSYIRKYNMYLRGANGKRITSRPFDTTVCVVRGSGEYLKQTSVVFNYNTPIWTATLFELRQHVPDFERAPFLVFRMIFSTGPVNFYTRPQVNFCTRDFMSTRPETANKMVQTPIQWETDPSLSLDFGRLLDGQTDSRPDVELKCGDNVTIRAHGSVLGARSEVFSSMLHTGMAEGRTGQVKVEDMDSGFFAEFIKYVYTGTLPELTVGLAKALYEARGKYGVGSLTPRCADFLYENMTPENALEYLALADAHKDRDFKEKAMAYVLDKNIPLQDDRWLPFSNNHPKIAAEVLLRGFKSFRRQ